MTTKELEGYWKECLSNALHEENLSIDNRTLEVLASAAMYAHENYSLAFHQPSSRDHYEPQIRELEDQLKKERAKSVCQTCRGEGRITSQGPHHSSNSECYSCRGDGKI